MEVLHVGALAAHETEPIAAPPIFLRAPGQQQPSETRMDWTKTGKLTHSCNLTLTSAPLSCVELEPRPKGELLERSGFRTLAMNCMMTLTALLPF